PRNRAMIVRRVSKTAAGDSVIFASRGQVIIQEGLLWLGGRLDDDSTWLDAQAVDRLRRRPSQKAQRGRVEQNPEHELGHTQAPDPESLHVEPEMASITGLLIAFESHTCANRQPDAAIEP